MFSSVIIFITTFHTGVNIRKRHIDSASRHIFLRVELHDYKLYDIMKQFFLLFLGPRIDGNVQ